MTKFYKGKKVFLTGHTGFKGAWLALWLKSLGADVCGYSLAPNTEPSIFAELGIDFLISGTYADITDTESLEKEMSAFEPEVIFHLAAQPLVRFSYKQPVITYQTNVIGTLNVLESARKCSSVKSFVNVTTDKCYENKEIGWGYREDQPMGGHDMYSSSKGCVEIMASSYRRSFLNHGEPFALGCARAGNVIGGGDWAKDRLVPDCISAINRGEAINIRNPKAVRPWQHVLEPLSGYLLLGELLYSYGDKYAQGYNFGPNNDSVLTVANVAKKIVDCYGRGEVVVGYGDGLHEASLLMLNIDKAKNELNWEPKYTVDLAIAKSVDWYRKYYSRSVNMLEYTMNQIKEYEDA